MRGSKRVIVFVLFLFSLVLLSNLTHHISQNVGEPYLLAAHCAASCGAGCYGTHCEADDITGCAYCWDDASSTTICCIRK